MRFLLTTLAVQLSLATIALSTNYGNNVFQRAAEIKARHAERRSGRPILPEKNSLSARQSSPFLNDATQKFVVNGSAIPDVQFDIGDSYAGLLPISGDANESRQLYFWFFPTTNPDASEEIVIWLNGGPGCSSLSGLLTENGPFLWQSGTLAPVPNSYSWTNLTNVLWVEQPVGVGYSQGEPNITNEEELSQQFIGFYKQFVDAFQVKNYKTYITGESYAGMYVPYIADAFISANDSEYYNLAGISINDPLIGDGTLQEQAVIVPFVEYWSQIFYLNESFTKAIEEAQTSCGYRDYYNKYFKFPPPAEAFPVLPPITDNNTECDLFDIVYAGALETNPCFNLYHITETCPHMYSVLGIVNEGDYDPVGSQIYFNRSDVKAAINAPADSNWQQCTDRNVFNFGYVNNYTLGDTSLGPAQNDVLKRVIEHTNNTIVGSGNLDMILSTNGTLLALQNVTWNGAQGLSEYPSTPLYVPYHPEYNGGRLSESGHVGYWSSERGLTFYAVQLAGHQLPGYAAGAGYRMLEILLGRVQDFGVVGDFTTQQGGFQGTNSSITNPTRFQGL